jgi:hypothetical protein
MKKTVFAAAVTAAFIVTAGAGAADTRTLSEFLLTCSVKTLVCRGNLEDYLRAANSQGFVCLPQGLSMEKAVDQELRWLRQQHFTDPSISNSNVEDAEWAAINALWPCKKE